MTTPPEASIVLTVMIPVYNGGKYLGSLLGMFAEAYADNPAHFEGVELFVADNRSEDDTASIVASHQRHLPMLRTTVMEIHLPSAEENVFRSFSHCRGTYTWALGVDDIPNFSCFGRAVQLLRAGEYDFYHFNFATVSEKMLLRRTSNMYFAAHTYPMNIVDFTQRFGFWYAIAGISGQIVRTEMIRNYDLASLITASSKIYSHVVGYLECFKDKKTVLVNEPLVFYKVTHGDLEHWERFAKKINVFNYFFWTLGYIRQLEYLERRNVIPASYLRRMLECNEFTFQRPVIMIAVHFLQQLRLMNHKRKADMRNYLSAGDYAEIRDYLFRKDPFLREFLWGLDALYKKITEDKKISFDDWRTTQELLDTYSTDYLFGSLLVGNYERYEIYAIAQRFYAVLPSYRAALVERLRFLDEDEIHPLIFSGESLEALQEKIAAYLRGHRRELEEFLRNPPPAAHADAALGEHRGAHIARFTVYYWRKYGTKVLFEKLVRVWRRDGTGTVLHTIFIVFRDLLRPRRR